MILGHLRTSTSDIDLLRDPANRGPALAATGSIMEEICALVRGAVHRTDTADGANSEG